MWQTEPPGLRVVAADGQSLAWLPTSAGTRAEGVAFAPDAPWVAISLVDNRGAGESDAAGVELWNWRTGIRLASVTLPFVSPSSVAFDADGRRLLVARQSEDPGVEVWDVSGLASGALRGDVRADDIVLRSIDGHTEWVQEAVWGPDERSVVSCSGDGTARVWDVATGRGRQWLVADGLTGLCRVRVSPDGRHVAVSDGENGIRVFALDPSEVAEIARARLTRTWTTDECREYLDLSVCPT